MNEGLYDDLDTIGQNIEFQNIQKEHGEFKIQVDSLSKECDDTKKQLNEITIEKIQLEKNMVTLYNTALRDLARKDKEILELKQIINDLRNSTSKSTINMNASYEDGEL